MPDRLSMLPPTLEALAEQYLDIPRACLVCREAPAITPLVYVADATGEGGLRRCAVFGTCAVCWCQDDFEHRVNEALQQDQHQREAAVWN